MAKIPKKVLKWRAKQPRGAIMTPERFASIEKGAAKGGARNPKGVAGGQYWDEVMQDYAASHCPAKSL